MTTRVRQHRSDRRLSWPIRLWVGGVALILLAPTIAVIPMSFSSSTTFGFPPPGWSLRWYREFFGSPEWISSLVASLQVATLVAIFATVLGTVAAVGLDRTRFRGVAAIRGVLFAPIIVPMIIVAVAIYAMFLRWHLTGTPVGLVLAHTAIAIPFPIITVSTSLAGFDRTLEDAASSLGANRMTTFLRVVAPQLLPGILSGFVIAFAVSLDEVVIALFLQSPTFFTLPVKMFRSVSLETDPTISAAATLLVVATMLVLLVAQLYEIRKRR